MGAIISIAVGGFYIWQQFIDSSSPLVELFAVGDITAIVAGILFIFSITAFFTVKGDHATRLAPINYFVMLVLVALAITDTGLLSSPYIALWVVLIFTAPIFGWVGYSSLIAAYSIYFVVGATLDTVQLFSVLIMSIVTLIAGLFAWRRKQTIVPMPDGEVILAKNTKTATAKSDVVIAAITEGVVALDSKGVIELINPSAQKIIGWNREDVLGLSYQSVLKLYDLRDKQPEAINDPIQQALTTNKQVHSETMKLETADSGRKFLAAITASPVGSAGSGVIVVFRDITREKAEEREQAEFISTASHEMRTPVASIEGFLGLALNPRTATVDDKAREYIAKAQESVRHLGQLFQDLLDVSKADDGRLTNNPEVIDMIPFLHDITQGLLPKANEKNLHIDFKPLPDLYSEAQDPNTDKIVSPAYYLEVDKGHLREVLANLIENAIKYTPHGTVTIDVTGDEDHVTVSVADFGIGIPKEDLPHLFQKFYRVDNTDTREIGGTGLGLYLSRKLTEAIGGKIWVESIYKQGSTFYVQLPRLDNVTARQKIDAIASTKPTTATLNTPQPAIPPLSTQPTQPQPAEMPVSNPQSPTTTPQKAVPAPPQPPVVSPPTSIPITVPPAPSSTRVIKSTIPAQNRASTIPARPSIAQLSPDVRPRAIPVTSPPRQNIPLSTIENNPEQYVRQAPPQ